MPTKMEDSKNFVEKLKSDLLNTDPRYAEDSGEVRSKLSLFPRIK